MSVVRIALANLSYPHTPSDAVARVQAAIAEGARGGAAVICFPEVYVPGYRIQGKSRPAPDTAFLERAWDAIAQEAAKGKIVTVLGTERVVDGQPRITT